MRPLQVPRETRKKMNTKHLQFLRTTLRTIPLLALKNPHIYTTVPMYASSYNTIKILLDSLVV
jgi:hypothetical protein